MRAFSYAWSLPVTWQRWRHTIRSIIAENLMLQANFIALRFIEPELLPVEVLRCGNRHFDLFLLQWPWPWPDDLYIRSWSVFHKDVPAVFERYRLTDRQTDTAENTTPLRGWTVVIDHTHTTNHHHHHHHHSPRVQRPLMLTTLVLGLHAANPVHITAILFGGFTGVFWDSNPTSLQDQWCNLRKPIKNGLSTKWKILYITANVLHYYDSIRTE